MQKYQHINTRTWQHSSSLRSNLPYIHRSQHYTLKHMHSKSSQHSQEMSKENNKLWLLVGVGSNWSTHLSPLVERETLRLSMWPWWFSVANSVLKSNFFSSSTNSTGAAGPVWLACRERESVTLWFKKPQFFVYSLRLLWRFKRASVTATSLPQVCRVGPNHQSAVVFMLPATPNKQCSMTVIACLLDYECRRPRPISQGSWIRASD